VRQRRFAPRNSPMVGLRFEGDLAAGPLLRGACGANAASASKHAGRRDSARQGQHRRELRRAQPRGGAYVGSLPVSVRYWPSSR
jgi:hypothetical protein